MCNVEKKWKCVSRRSSVTQSWVASEKLRSACFTSSGFTSASNLTNGVWMWCSRPSGRPQVQSTCTTPIYEGVEYFSKETQQQVLVLNTFQRKMCCWDWIFLHRHRTNLKLKSGPDQQGRAWRIEGFVLDLGRYLKWLNIAILAVICNIFHNINHRTVVTASSYFYFWKETQRMADNAKFGYAYNVSIHRHGGVSHKEECWLERLATLWP